jgi:hypothetical protein
MSAFILSNDGVNRMKSGSESSELTLQVVNLQSFQANQQQRYRCFLSDGANMVQSVFKFEHNTLFEDKIVMDKSIILIKSYIMQKQICWVIDFHVVRPTSTVDIETVPQIVGGTPVELTAPSSSSVSIPEAVVSTAITSTPVLTIDELKEGVGRFKIIGVVTAKKPTKPYANNTGGQFFVIEFTDKPRQDIKVVFFTDTLHFYQTMKVNAVYWFENLVVKKTDPKFNTCLSTLELQVQSSSVIAEASHETSSIFHPLMIAVHDFKCILDLHTKCDVGSLVDIIAYIKDTTGFVSFYSTKQDKTFYKCVLTLEDDTGGIEFTFWDDIAKKMAEYTHSQVIVIRKARLALNHKRARQLTCTAESTEWIVDPVQFPKYQMLKSLSNAI